MFEFDDLCSISESFVAFPTKASKFTSMSDECHMIDVVDSLVWEAISNHQSDDPLKHCILNDSSAKDTNPEVAMCAQLLEASP